jgi:hypothetical protein
MVHEKRREHACPYCEGVAFQTKRCMRSAGTTPAPTALAHSGRREKGSLKKNIKVVHEKRRDHVCPYCEGVAFGTASNLKMHISAIHLKIKHSRGTK